MSIKVDLYAPIVPSKGAAGFKIGDSRESIINSVSNINLKILGLKVIQDPHSSQVSIVTLEDNQEVIILNFSNEDILYQLFLLEGYKGLLFEDIRVGDNLSKTKKYFKMFYDDGDELYYPEDINIGIGFYASEFNSQELDEEVYFYEDQDILIDGEIYLISVHDYNLIRA